MSNPAIEAVPLVGEMSPVRILNVVVLPAPEEYRMNALVLGMYLYVQCHVGYTHYGAVVWRALCTSRND